MKGLVPAQPNRKLPSHRVADATSALLAKGIWHVHGNSPCLKGLVVGSLNKGKSVGGRGSGWDESSCRLETAATAP